MSYCRNKLNLKQAIDFIAQAWNQVRGVTIANCWKVTGILPNMSCDLSSIQTLAEQAIRIADGEVEALFVDLRDKPNPKTVELVHDIQ